MSEEYLEFQKVLGNVLVTRVRFVNGFFLEQTDPM